MHQRPGRRLFFALLTVALATPSAGVFASGPAVTAYPEAPTLAPPVHGFETVDDDGDGAPDRYAFAHPSISPLSTTADHRVGLLRRRVGHANAETLFYVTAPERLNPTRSAAPGVDFISGDPGATLLGDHVFSLPSHHFDGVIAGTPIERAAQTATHLAVCDPGNAQPPPGEICDGGNCNPYACGERDCYDLVVVTAIKREHPDGHGQIQLRSTPITVRVKDPKTAAAEIETISVDPAGAKATAWLGDHGTGIREFHTPMIVGDNRLLVVRIGAGSDHTWHDPAGQPHQGRWDTVYAYDPDAAPCDVDGWPNLKPFTYAPTDPDLRLPPGDTPRFGFAAYPFRSPSGLPITHAGPTDLRDIGTRYIWMDRDADNLFFGSLHRRLLDAGGPGTDLYDVTCLDGSTASCSPSSLSESATNHMGWMMMGLWTRGKMVLLDGLFNHTDLGLRGDEDSHRRVRLYADTDPGTEDDSHVRVGTGVHITDVRVNGDPSTSPHGWILTTVQLEALEHNLFMEPAARPRTPRDVVWQVATGAQADEIAFDDLISSRTLIFSPMNALKEMAPTGVYYDGFHDHDGSLPPMPSPHNEMRLQNAATSLVWTPPAYGAVLAPSTTQARIEHVARGGIKGRGFHLDPESRIAYTIPIQDGAPDPKTREWLVSLFFDWRVDPAGSARRLVTFPGGAHAELLGHTFLKICPAGSMSCPAVRLPRTLHAGGWTHLALHLVPDPQQPGTGTVRSFQDGFLFAERPLPAGMTIEPGTLTVGAAPAGGLGLGVGGWIDELKVIEGPFTYEELCNHARGTLRAVPAHYTSLAGNRLATMLQRFEAAASYPDAVSGQDAIHQALYGTPLDTASDRYVCDVDYARHEGVSAILSDDPAARSIRHRLLTPEGALVWDQPRPDTSGNAFCAGCHSADGPFGLGLDALTLAQPPVPAYLDPRRQPSQPPAAFLGRVPPGYLAGSPSVATEQPLLDPWFDNGPLYHWSMDEGTGTTVGNLALGDVTAPDAARGTLEGATFGPGRDRAHALVFDGGADGSAADLVRIGSAFDIDGSAISLAAWFRLGVDGLSAAPASRCTNFNPAAPCTLIAKSDDVSNGEVDWSLRIFYFDDTTWRMQLKTKIDSVPQQFSVDLPNVLPDTWYHAVAVFDHGRFVIYLDGVEVDRTGTAAGHPGLGTGIDHPVTLGARTHAGNGSALHPFFGSLDDVRVYNRALDANEVVNLYESGS